MGTKKHPGQFDCYGIAMIDEPMFILLARDPAFAPLVRAWADRRMADIECGNRPLADNPMVSEAIRCARDGAEWRRVNLGIWRLR